jgi:ribosome maturation factor RimP
MSESKPEDRGCFSEKHSGRDYQLEVSSPGVEKSLEFPYEYRRNLGRILEAIHETAGVTTAAAANWSGTMNDH